MPAIHLNLEGDNAWPDLEPDGFVVGPEEWRLAVLERGMSSGKPSIALRLDLPTGQTVIAQTSLAAWIAVTCALRGRYPDEFIDTPLEEHWSE